MDYTELKQLHEKPLFDLIDKARSIYKLNFKEDKVQLCTLLSIKTGGCSEDCAYCSQSARYGKNIDSQPLMDPEEVLKHAKRAKANGAERFCMGAAWKGIKSGSRKFEQVLKIVRNVADQGLEVCVTLGEIGFEEAKRLHENGVKVYNHNIDTSEDFYPSIVSTHTFQDRITTLQNARKAGLELCCGGILGMGETIDDRLKMLEVLSKFDPQPESVPINLLTPMPGTPLEEQEPIDTFELVKIIAVARIALPKTKVRLSAGRKQLSQEAQTLCFFAGANSIFYGDKLLTADNPKANDDMNLLKKLSLAK